MKRSIANILRQQLEATIRPIVMRNIAANPTQELSPEIILDQLIPQQREKVVSLIAQIEKLESRPAPVSTSEVVKKVPSRKRG